jgi:hypothetical protein
LPIEFCLDPDGEMFGRLLVYLGRLWLEKRPVQDERLRYHVGAVVVNLTGRGNASRDLALRQTGIRTCLQVAERNLSTISAADTLAGIAAIRIARCVVPWIPLLQGGGEMAIIQEWIRLADPEPDRKLRADYAGLALVFAEAAGCRDVWKQALQGWNMIESQQVLEWINEGEVRGRATTLLQVLQLRFGTLPADLVGTIRATTDPGQLERWVQAAVRASSLDEFRQQL